MAEIHEVLSIAKGLEPAAISPDMPAHSAMQAMRLLGQCAGKALGVASFSGQTGWERHADDEFLYYLEGEAELRVMTDGGESRRIVREGEAAVVPKGLWHSQRTIRPVRLLFITQVSDSEHATAPDGLLARPVDKP